MSRKLIDKARRRLTAESGPHPKAWGGRLSVALVFPNRYHHAMSNLGFQTVHHLLNQRDDTLCERFFLPDPEDLAEHRKTGFPLFSLESQRPLSDFDVVAFSISFENDYLNLPILFELGRLPLWRAERDERQPLVLCGGVCAFLNPEPLAEIMDLFAIGEAEVLLDPLLEALQTGAGDRATLLAQLAQVPGWYVPQFYTVAYHPDQTVAAITATPPAPAQVKRQWLADLDSSASRTFIFTDDTEFGDMALTEVSRGCSRGCRFCAAGYLFLPPRERSLARLEEQIAEGLCARSKQGLVGAAVSDHSQIAALQQTVLDQGGSVSVSSLRLDALGEAEVASLAASGHRSVAIAPEAGSQRLRDLINKGLDTAQILQAVERIAASGIPNLKLYFLIGLPSETDADMAELLELVTAIRNVWLAEGKKRGRLGHITLSVNPFIPKPFTPLQWAAMADEATIALRLKQLRSGIRQLGNVELINESPRSAQLQAFLSRGDRRCGRTLPLLAAGKNLRAACRSVDLDPAFFLGRPRSEQELFPWDVLDSGVARAYLWREYQQAGLGRSTPRCAPGCRRCGVCA